MSEQSGLNTPPFGGQHLGTPAGPHYTPDGRLAGYTGADFPAPAGVAVLQPAPPTPPKAKTRLGAVIAASALSAALGVGAGIGSYAYFTGGTIASPITVTTQQAASQPKLD